MSRCADPHAFSGAVLTVVDTAKPPRRIVPATGPLDLVREVYAARSVEWGRAMSSFVGHTVRER